MDLKYRRDIDGIRAIAVVAVVFFHAFPKSIPGGFIGVDVFFVISGFLISNIIFQQITNKQFNWTTFYIKRINRLFPTLIIILFCALLSGYFLLFSEEYQNLSKHILGSTFFINNFLLWKEAGYFDITNEFKPLLHLWSLGIEEQFYLIWPLFILLIWNKKYNPIIAIILINTLSFLINILGATQHGVAIFYLPISRFWELGIGGALAYARSVYINSPQKIIDTNKNYSLLLNSLSISSLFTLLFAVFYFKNTFIYPGWPALLPTLCTAILLCTSNTWVNSNLLTKPFLTLVGVISYPLYLWHWELFSFAHIILSGPLPYLLTFTLLISSFGLAWLTYNFIEKPIRFNAKGKKYAPITANISVLILFGLGGVAFMIYKEHGLESRVLAQTQKALITDMKNFEEYRRQVYPCEINNNKIKNLGWCLQTHQGLPNKVIWGDSHADHLFPGLLKHDPQNNWLLLGQSSCPPLLGIQGFWVGFKDTCAKANKIALQAILTTPSIDTVVLASIGPFYISDQGYAAQHLEQYAPSRFILRSEKKASNLQDKTIVFYEGLDLTISKLRAAGKKIVLFQDIPEIPFMPGRCLDRPLAPQYPCYISQKEVLKRQKVYKTLLTKLQAKYPDILIFNPLGLMCHQQKCPLIYKHHLIYRDSHHLSIKGSHFIGKNFLAWIKQQSKLVS